MRNRGMHAATWILSRLLPADERGPLVGDLVEEYALRLKSASPSAAFTWYLRQVGASAAPLLWTRLRRAAWLSTVGAALFAYIAVGVVEFAVNRVMPGPVRGAAIAYTPLSLIIPFPAVVLIGYCAARYRRRSPIVLAGLMLLAVTGMTLSSTENTPVWYRIAFFVVGPAAVLIGSALHSRQHA